MADKIRSNWWYLLPLSFGIIGGVIGYFIIRKDDPQKARNILIVGIVVLAVEITFNLFSLILNLTALPPLSFMS